MDKNAENPKRSKGERAAFIILPIFGVLVLILGFFQFRSAIRKPFSANYVPFVTEEEKELKDLAALHTKDTDQDGLSDYDELYVYNTSPYLADSDSDGYTDKEEIDSGHNPNCPTGQNCAQPREGQASAVDLYTTQLLESSASEPASQMLNILQGAVSTEQIRAQLKQAGVPDNVLEKVSDQQLLELYNETLSEVSSADANAGARGGENLDFSEEELKALLGE